MIIWPLNICLDVADFSQTTALRLSIFVRQQSNLLKSLKFKRAFMIKICIIRALPVNGARESAEIEPTRRGFSFNINGDCYPI